MKTIETLIKEGANELQAKVIANLDKELIVPAGAGSGKTKTLVTKMVELIEMGHPLDSFLVLTFTKKAAEEMKERIKKILISKNLNDLASKVDSSYVSTFDSYAYNFVKQHASKINLDSNLELLDGSVFKIIKNEMMEELVLSFMIHGSKNQKQFINDFTQKKSSQSLIDTLITAYEKVSNSHNLNDVSAKDLIKPIDIINKDDLLDKIREISDDFYGDEKNNKILYDYAEYIDYLNGLLPDKPLLDKANFNWKVFDAVAKEIYKPKIEKVIKPIKDLVKLNVSREDIEFLNRKKYEYIETMIDILKDFEANLMDFKQNANKYEFNDISNFLNKILNENIDIRNRLKDQFKFIFVDEYQDTSKVQSIFLDMLIEDNNEIHVMYVGDLKQSIYKFRNAKPESFINKQKEATVIGLNTNYRSHKDVIEFINKIFKSILNDEKKYDINYNEQHIMLSGSTKFNQDPLTGVYAIELFTQDKVKPDKAEEAFVVGNKILELKNSNKIKNFNEVAILSRNTSNFKHYVDVFNYLGIPLQVQVDVNLNDTYLLKLMASILVLAKNLYVNDKKTFELKRLCYLSLVRSEIFSKNDFEILKQLIDMDANQDKRKILNIENPIFLGLAKLNKVIFSLTNEEIINELLAIFNIQNEIVKTTDLEKKKLQIDYLQNLCQPMADLNIVGPLFIDYIYKIAFDDNPLKVSVLQESTENSVKITNIHQSKGLEYEVLFCVGLNNSFGLKEKSNVKYSPENLLEIYPSYSEEENQDILIQIDKTYKKSYKVVTDQSQLKEELRLLYVAFTRAEKALYIITTPSDDNSDLNSFADYLYEHNFKEYIDAKNITKLNEFMTVSGFRNSLKEAQMYYPEVISKFSKNNTSFNYSKLKKVKASNQISKLISDDVKVNLEKGNLLHHRLEFKDYKLSYDDLIFKKLSETNFNHKFIKDSIQYLNEYEFSYIVDDNEITGIIDLLVIYDDQIHIIDFKTKDINEDKYYNQLKVYKSFIQSISNKVIKTYLYAITTFDVNEVIIHD